MRSLPAGVFLLLASKAAWAGLSASPAQIGTGVTIAGQMQAADSPIYSILALKGDTIEFNATGTGSIEFAVFGADGKPLMRQQGEPTASGSFDAKSDGVYVVSVLAPANSRFTLRVQRVKTGRPVAKAPPPVDPDWGVYARLPGQEREAQGGYRLRWRWEAANSVLLEEWIDPHSGKVRASNRISRGGTPGELLLQGSSDRTPWTGRVAADGSVSWSGSRPFRVQLLEDDRFRWETLSKSGEVRDTTLFAPADANGVIAALQPTLDPAQWGVFAGLVGATVHGPRNSGLFYAWSVAEDGSILQDRGATWGQQHIRVAGPGSLTIDDGKGYVVTGTIEPDGSVVWDHKRGGDFRFSIQGGILKLEEGRRTESGTFETFDDWILEGNLPTPAP